MDLSQPDLDPCPLGEETREEFLKDWYYATRVLRDGQMFRKSYLSFSSMGQRPVSEYDGLDTVPKDLGRVAGQLHWFINPKPETGTAEEKHNYVTGLQHIVDLVRKAGDEHSRLLHCLNNRQSGDLLREQHPLSPNDQMLLWEILVSEAIEVLEARLASIQQEALPAAPLGDARSMWRTMPPWMGVEQTRRALAIGSRPTCWIPVEGTGVFAYRKGDIDATVSSEEMRLHPDFADVYDLIASEESRPSGKTNEELLALAGYDIARVGAAEYPSLHLKLQPTLYYRFLASTIDPRAANIRTRHLRRFRADEQSLPEFPNGVGLCLLVLSSDDKFLFGLRSASSVGPRKGEWDVTVVEGLHATKDVNTQTWKVDFWGAALRALYEETGHSAQPADIELLGFGVDMEFYQWNVIGMARVRTSAIEIMSGRVRRAKDRYEYAYLEPLSSEPTRALEFLWQSRMWSSGLAAAYYSLVRIHGTAAVEQAAAALP